jgi:hypothetical protein
MILIIQNKTNKRYKHEQPFYKKKTAKKLSLYFHLINIMEECGFDNGLSKIAPL